MEPPNPETQTKVQQPQHKPHPQDSAQQPSGDANAADLVKGSPSQGPAEQSIERNGDANAAGLGNGSPSQGPTEQSMQLIDSSAGSIKKSVHWSPELFTESTFVSSPDESPRRLSSSSMSSPSFSVKDTVETVRNVLGIWGRRVGEATRKAENLAGNTWQHLRTNPSFAEAALGRIARGTKVLAEGGDEKIFRQTFDTVPEEQLQKSYACYLSTSAGPVMGVLYISTAKIAYCSDNPLSFIADEHTEWSYYKVTVPLNELKAVDCSSSGVNPAEKYIQVTSVDNNEFWFMGFLNYEGAVEFLVEAFQANKLPSEQ